MPRSALPCPVRAAAAELVAVVRDGGDAELEAECPLDELLLDRLERTRTPPAPRRVHHQATPST